MKKMVTLIIMTLMLIAFGVATAEAASTAPISVTVTITATALDVTVLPTSWAIGPISAGGTKNTTLPDYFTATNNRNTTEDLTLTAVSSAGWTFANTPGADQFGMNFSTAGAVPSWTLIDSSTGTLLANDLGAGASETFDLQLEVPTSTTVGGTPQTIIVTVTAS